MAAALNPYLTFDGNARDAMEFYRSVFGGELTVSTFEEYGTQGEGADGVMHARLATSAGFTLMASDTPPGQSHTAGGQIAISLSGDEAQSLRGYWEQLSAQGAVEVPLEKQMWGDEFGACKDRFGIPWMVNIGSAE